MIFDNFPFRSSPNFDGANILIKRADKLRFTQCEIVDIIQTHCFLEGNCLTIPLEILLTTYLSNPEEPRYNAFTIGKIVYRNINKNIYFYPYFYIWYYDRQVVERAISSLKEFYLNAVFHSSSSSLQNCCIREIYHQNLSINDLPPVFVKKFTKWYQIMTNKLFDIKTWKEDAYSRGILKCWQFIDCHC